MLEVEKRPSGREGNEEGFQGIRSREEDGEITGNIELTRTTMQAPGGFIFACLVNCYVPRT